MSIEDRTGVAYSIKESPLNEIGDSLVMLSEIIEDEKNLKKRGLFSENEAYDCARQTAFNLLKQSDLPPEIISPYWRIYRNLLAEAEKLDSEKKDKMISERKYKYPRELKTHPLAGYFKSHKVKI